MLKLSARTLQRRLRDEGLTFTGVVAGTPGHRTADAP
jgi:hypothetical protein